MSSQIIRFRESTKVLLILSLFGIIPSVISTATITFNPENALKIVQSEHFEIKANLYNISKHDIVLQLTSLDTKVASLQVEEFTFTPQEKVNIIKIDGHRLGLTQIRWEMYENSKFVASGYINVSVTRGRDNIQLIFTIFVVVLISINNINMGCFLDLETIKKVLRTPIAPIIGFFCQFLFMPLVRVLIDDSFD